LLSVAGCLLAGLAAAQISTTTTWPQYVLYKLPGDVDSQVALSETWQGAGRQQCIYTPAMFPDAPEGRVVNLYFRLYVITNGPANDHNVVAPVYDTFSLKIGYTEDSLFRTQHNTVKVPFRTGLKTIYEAPPAVAFQPTDTLSSRGAWVKVPLGTTQFNFSRRQNFVVEWKFKSRANDTLIAVKWWIFGDPYLQRELHYALGADSSSKGSTGGVIAIGFDIEPASVSGLSNLRGAGLFPNPATDGRFNISLDAKQPMKEVSIAITDITGREVLSRKYAHPGSSFFEEINLSGAAKGMYFVRIAADGEVISRRVSIQ
jgi:hypothetical protein